MIKTFENPLNGYREKAGSVLSPLWVFLFGPVYFAACGLWQAVLIYLMIVVPVSIYVGTQSAPIVGIVVNAICAFCVYGELERKFLRQGWREISAEKTPEEN